MKRIGLFEIETILLNIFLKAHPDDKQVLGKYVEGKLLPINIVDIIFLSLVTRASPPYFMDKYQTFEVFLQQKGNLWKFQEIFIKKMQKTFPSVVDLMGAKKKFESDPTKFVKSLEGGEKIIFYDYQKVFKDSLVKWVNDQIPNPSAGGKHKCISGVDLINKSIYWSDGNLIPIFKKTVFSVLDDSFENDVRQYIEEIIKTK